MKWELSVVVYKIPGKLKLYTFCKLCSASFLFKVFSHKWHQTDLTVIKITYPKKQKSFLSFFF